MAAVDAAGLAEAAHCPGTQIVSVADSESDIYEVIAEGMGTPSMPTGSSAPARTAPWSTTCGRTGAARTISARSSWRRPCSISGRSRSVVGPRRWPARTGTDGSRGSRGRRSSRSAPCGSRSAPRSGRPGNWPMPRSTPCSSPRWIRPRTTSPVEWLLLTSLPIDTVDQVRLVVQYYSTRWMVEVFFRVLKSGCRVEDRRFEERGRGCCRAWRST